MFMVDLRSHYREQVHPIYGSMPRSLKIIREPRNYSIYGLHSAHRVEVFVAQMAGHDRHGNRE
jgi:hypothetical protein